MRYENKTFKYPFFNYVATRVVRITRSMQSLQSLWVVHASFSLVYQEVKELITHKIAVKNVEACH